MRNYPFLWDIFHISVSCLLLHFFPSYLLVTSLFPQLCLVPDSDIFLLDLIDLYWISLNAFVPIHYSSYPPFYPMWLIFGTKGFAMLWVQPCQDVAGVLFKPHLFTHCLPCSREVLMLAVSWGMLMHDFQVFFLF